MSDSNGTAEGTDAEVTVKMEDVIVIDPEAEDLELNHGRIGIIERLEPLVNLKRLVGVGSRYSSF